MKQLICVVLLFAVVNANDQINATEQLSYHCINLSPEVNAEFDRKVNEANCPGTLGPNVEEYLVEKHICVVNYYGLVKDNEVDIDALKEFMEFAIKPGMKELFLPFIDECAQSFKDIEVYARINAIGECAIGTSMRSNVCRPAEDNTLRRRRHASLLTKIFNFRKQ